MNQKLSQVTHKYIIIAAVLQLTSRKGQVKCLNWQNIEE